ncbi:MAG: 1-acyl-sn-glycerol-3-phosphate acyltransferase [Firmicutes bacterium]|nr:1-acyl-sn-glycerol-3-phosphate acyltransferase [Bacillota bacterium]
MFYYLIRNSFAYFFKVFYLLNFDGLENLPLQGPYIICANHTSWFDPPLVGSLPLKERKIYFMAKEELFKIFPLGFILKKLEAFPVKRNIADRKAIRRALQVLSAGGILGLFPEGTRMRTGELGKPHHGAALIALKSKKPVLPIAIKWPPRIFQPVKINIGPLIYFEEGGKIKGEVLEKISLQIMAEIKKLL